MALPRRGSTPRLARVAVPIALIAWLSTGGSAGRGGDGPATLIFADGFESGDTSAWSADAEAPVCSRDGGGLTPAQLLANIDTFVVLMMEGRSFDHYLGSLSLVEGKPVNGLTGTESNPAPGGGTVAVHQLADYTLEAPPVTWDAAHAQWNNGANDGFVTQHAGAGQADVMGYYVRSQLPITYALADRGVVCDGWFSSVLGPTWPNRYYLHGATSNGVQNNLPIPSGFTSIFDVLDDAGVTHTNYYGSTAWASGAYLKFSGLANIDAFFTAAAAGTLPAFSLIDPSFFGPGTNSDQPGTDVLLGQALIASVFGALAASPQWESSLFVLVYSNHGGFYDHVPPPTTVDALSAFQQLGFRVPAIVAGPFVNPGCVLSTTLEHVSVIKTLTTRYDLPAMNARVTAASDLSGAVHAPFLDDPRPPPTLPPLDLSSSMLDELRARGATPERLAVVGRVLEHGRALGVLRLVGSDRPPSP